MKHNLISVSVAAPPKDRTFLGMFSGYPDIVMAAWCPADEKYVYADLRVAKYHGKDDFYFDTAREGAFCKLVAWSVPQEISTEEHKNLEELTCES